MEINKKNLLKFKGRKKEIERLESKIADAEMTEVPAVIGKVKGSSRNFPFIEVRHSVVMDDPVASEALEQRIKTYRDNIVKYEAEALEVEKYIQKIDDPEVRTIFRMYFIDGEKQKDIAIALNLERSTISKKIKDELQLSH